MRGRSDWLSEVTLDGTADAASAFEKVEQLLVTLQPVCLDVARSTASFVADHAQVDLHHVSELDILSISVGYSADGGGMFNPMGFEEYYRLAHEPPVAQDVLDDLATVLISAFEVEETFRKGRKVRTVVTQVEPGERSGGSSVSGWLLPPRWIFPQSQLTTERHRYSYTSVATGKASRRL